jgi:hypothetical protein
LPSSESHAHADVVSVERVNQCRLK